MKLLDFGVAESLDAIGSGRSGSQSRYMTLAYAAPEQVRHERTGNPVDVYALGVILFQLISGRLPYDFAGKSSDEIKASILSHPPRSLSSAAKQCPTPPIAGLPSRDADWRDLDSICVRALAAGPIDRYSSVDALSQDLGRYLSGQLLESRRPYPLPYRAGKFLRRNRRPVLTAALVLALIVSLTAFYTRRLARARNQALAETTRAQAVQDFILNMFAGNDLEAGPANSLRVVTVLDRGELEARSLANQPIVQAELYQTLGKVFQDLGRYDRAAPLLTAALEKRKTLFGSASPQAADSMLMLALLYEEQGNEQKAEPLARSALSLARTQHPPDPARIVRTQTGLAAVLMGRGLYLQAIPLFEDSLRIASIAPVPPNDFGDAVTDLGIINLYLGRLPQAETLARRALAMDLPLHGERHPFIAIDYENLAQVEESLNHYRDAEEHERRALEIAVGWFGPDSTETGEAMATLGQTLNFDGKYAESEALLTRALEIQKGFFPVPNRRVAFALNALGAVEDKRGKLDRAEAHLNAALAIYSGLPAVSDHRAGVVLSNLAGVFAKRRKFSTAESLLKRSLDVFARTLPPGNRQSGIAYCKLGDVFLLDRRYSDAEHWLLLSQALLLKPETADPYWLSRVRSDLATVHQHIRQHQNSQY